MYNNKLHIELAVRLIDRLIYVYICFCMSYIYNSLAKLLGDRLNQYKLTKKKAVQFLFLPYLQSQNLCLYCEQQPKVSRKIYMIYMYIHI